MYDMKEILVIAMSVGIACIAYVICYIIEALLLSKIASKRGRNPILAWIPILNFFLLRDMAGKKSRWQWLLGFLAAALLGNIIVAFFGLQALIWCMTIWYWSAFHTIMEAETDLECGWFFGAIFCFPVKLYVMHKMAE